MHVLPLGALAITALAMLASPHDATAEIRNIVIVHGAFADSSGWRAATEILEKDGYKVSLVQNPITSLQDDVDATHRVLDMQDGPSILVGHSYGGVVITEAGNHPNVAALVYVAAYQPAKGESLITLVTQTPGPSREIRSTKDDKFLYLDPAAFGRDFAADVPAADSAFMAKSQVLASKAAFSTPVGDPAWQNRKSWAIVATNDRTISPDLERRLAKRAGSTVVEIPASHAVFLSQPAKVAQVIATAARESGR
ncbi:MULTISPECIES: alpha/beta hydrolase [unclassified Lysobacter]|uniref:alpha/beta fold hydrolase n=1 Tax=unclassified Lysobacter TaxID=2635362 RepID=UPI001C225E48|nr:alpha/beta hydrolase [Lysobacter sp. MMG2]MBU8977798.1 alpha/beta hydrolase [Lysobacter sp. MMG2]